jgi:hypothetical protein
MQIEDFKRWHWALLGVAIGLIFAYAWQDHDVVGDKYYEMAEVKQVMFERESLSKSRESGQAILQNVRVEPPVRDYQNNLRQIVTGKRLRFNPKDQKEYLVPFYYYASIPYVPRVPVPDAPALAENATVVDYLKAAEKENPLLHFRYAWELQSNWFAAMWVIGGLVVIGGVWPTVLSVLLGAGLGRPSKSAEEMADAEYLKRFGKGKKKSAPVLAGKGPTDADFKQLDSMNAALEGELAAAGLSLTTAPAALEEAKNQAAPAPVIALNAEPGKPAPHERQHGETEEEYQLRYKPDDFYPVARSSHTKKE